MPQCGGRIHPSKIGFGILLSRRGYEAVGVPVAGAMDLFALQAANRLVGNPPGELVRRDARFRELGLDPAACDTREGAIAALLEHPELLQRPIVVRGERAVVARPPERVDELSSE